VRFAGRAGLLFSYSTRLITDSDATSYQYQPLPLLPPGTTLTPPKPKLKTESRPQSPPNCEVVVCSDWAVVADFTSECNDRLDQGLRATMSRELSP